jgi:hypothetical protein
MPYTQKKKKTALFSDMCLNYCLWHGPIFLFFYSKWFVGALPNFCEDQTEQTVVFFSVVVS